MPGKDIFTDAVTGLASNGRVPFISEIGRRMQFFPTRMLGYYKKGLYRRTRDYATWTNHREVRVPVAETRNGLVFWSPPAGEHIGLYEEYGIYANEGNPWDTLPSAGGDFILAYTDPFQPHRKFRISDIEFSDDPDSSEWVLIGDLSHPWGSTAIGVASGNVYTKYDAALYDYEGNFIGYLDSPDRKIVASDYRFFLPITPEVVALGEIKIQVATGPGTWPSDLDSVTLTIDGTDYLTMTGNGSWTMTVPVVDGSIGYLTTVATPVVPSPLYHEYNLVNGIDEYYHPTIESYVDSSGQSHIEYRDYIGVVVQDPPWVSVYDLGDFAPITEFSDYNYPLVYVNGIASSHGEGKEHFLELEEYELSSAPHLPESAVIDTWYQSYPIKKSIDVTFYLPDS